MDIKELIRRSWEVEANKAKSAQMPFLGEEVLSDHHYPKGRSILPITDQISRLQTFFPTLTYKGLYSQASLSALAEGWLVIPKPSFIASNYNGALEKALNLLEKERSLFLNCLRDELDTGYLRLTQRTEMALSHLNAGPHDELYFLQVQLGIRHIGKSARQAQFNFAEGEFGLGPYEIAIFLMTHSSWLSTPLDLGIDCIGCEYGPYRHGFFRYIPFFYFHEVLRFEERWCGCPDVHFGSATGFLS